MEGAPCAGNAHDSVHMRHCLHAQLQRWCGANSAFGAQPGRLQHRAGCLRRLPGRTHSCAEDGASAQGTTTSVADGALCPDELGPFVQFFRQASPYIEGHRGRTFVICCPGEVTRSSYCSGPCHARPSASTPVAVVSCKATAAVKPCQQGLTCSFVP